MLTEKWLRNPTNKTALEMDAVAVKIPVSIVKRMILVIKKCVFLKRGLRSKKNVIHPAIAISHKAAEPFQSCCDVSRDDTIVKFEYLTPQKR